MDIVAWPEDRPWEGRYMTSSSMDRGIYKLVLSPEIYHDAARANTSYRRFARKMSKAGLVPPNVEFRNMESEACKKIFCILTTKESVFNSACTCGKMFIFETGTGAARRIYAVEAGDEQIEPSDVKDSTEA